MTRLFVWSNFGNESSGHDYWHAYRVWQTTKHIAVKEKDVDTLTVELAALLHDIVDWKFHKGDIEAGPRAAGEWLSGLDVQKETIQHIQNIIRNLDFKGADYKNRARHDRGANRSRCGQIGCVGCDRYWSSLRCRHLLFFKGAANSAFTDDPISSAFTT